MGVPRRHAFTLVEILIVVIVLGILASLVVGMFNNTTSDASRNALKDNLRTMRSSIQLYFAQHAAFPDAGSFDAQMTQFTDATGATSASKTLTHIFGPYILTMPLLPVGANKGNSAITSTTYSAGFGWGYDAATGAFRANCADSEIDSDGIAYNTY